MSILEICICSHPVHFVLPREKKSTPHASLALALPKAVVAQVLSELCDLELFFTRSLSSPLSVPSSSIAGCS